MLGGTGERRTKTHACHDRSPTSIPMGGNATAEAFITRQWLPDFPKLLLTVAPRGHWQANRSSMKPFAIGAARLAALGFTVSGCIPQPWLASAGPRGYRRNQSKYQFATDKWFKPERLSYRASSQANGRLTSTSQQTVSTETQGGQPAIVIQPANPMKKSNAAITSR